MGCITSCGASFFYAYGFRCFLLQHSFFYGASVRNDAKRKTNLIYDAEKKKCVATRYSMPWIAAWGERK